jgi:DNA-binding MarR family transcriptional regulator
VARQTTATSAVSVIDRLEERGYARRERSATDRRKYLVEVTAALTTADETFFEPVPAARRRALRDAVDRLYRAHLAPQ